MGLHDLVHRSQPEDNTPKAVVTQKPAQDAPSSRETNLTAELNDAKRQVTDLMKERNDARRERDQIKREALVRQKKVEELTKSNEKLKFHLEGQEAYKATQGHVEEDLRRELDRRSEEFTKAQNRAFAMETEKSHWESRALRAEKEICALEDKVVELAGENERHARKAKPSQKVKKYTVELYDSTDKVRVFRANDVVMIEGGGVFFYYEGDIVGGVSLHEWKSLRVEDIEDDSSST